MGTKEKAGAAFPTLFGETLSEIWLWTRASSLRYEHFKAKRGEVEEEQDLSGFQQHGAHEADLTDAEEEYEEEEVGVACS